jgi:alkylation response protein AidB-like acyl-CoA dehydrogenase
MVTMSYVPPLADIRFVLDNIVDLEGLAAVESFAHADAATSFDLLAESGRFFADVLAPLNRTGDLHPSRWNDDQTVTTPPGWVDAYRRYVDAGWGVLPHDPEIGGGGFPQVVAVSMQEMLTASNMAFSLAPLLTQGAIDLLHHHAGEEQQQTYLPKMVTGEWTGTMNLTEPEAGSDVGQVRTKAEPAGDGTWRISGQKIFITYGEHDLTEQIVHLVLARTPGAPPGTRGISCFIVPKRLVNADGSLGERNDVRCLSVEHKLGIHGSPTAVMSFGESGGAVGYLIGDENCGMQYMFTMMNNARLGVGLSGLAIGEAATQQAVAYARERHQGTAPGAPAGTVSPIIDLPDVRRMLMTMRAHVEAMRCLVYVNAEALDRARAHPDPEVRVAAKERADLLTPITKAWCTDLGCELASLNIQVHGGVGYIEETGAALLLRDIRIAPIYEGTNGIQAIDLVMRKLTMRDGAAVEGLLDEMRAVDAELTGAGDELATIRQALAEAVSALAEATAWIQERRHDDDNGVLAGATPYLRLFGTVAGGWLLARSALAAHRILSEGSGDRGFLEAKVATARFYASRALPSAQGLVAEVCSGSTDVMGIPVDAL